MTTPPVTAITGTAIPRLDPGAAGIHLVWAGPELTPLATGGYTVRRRPHLALKTTSVCAVFDSARLAALAAVRVTADELGVMLLHDWRPQATAPGELPVAHASNFPWSVFTQELTAATQRVTVTCTAASAFAIAVSHGKAVAVSALSAGSAGLPGSDIDTVVVYAMRPAALTICSVVPAEPERDQASWAAADVLASGLTLPLHEADPSLHNETMELARARERLVGNETLTDQEAAHLADALRQGAADLTGRPCDRVLLDRVDVTDPLQETLFSTRIGLLTLDPRLRRVLGFGFADRTAVAGQAYDYLVSGSFSAADLSDDVYDVHQIPSGTALPSAFRIRDVGFRFGGPTTVVLDPPPGEAVITAQSGADSPCPPAHPSSAGGTRTGRASSTCRERSSASSSRYRRRTRCAATANRCRQARTRLSPLPLPPTS
jgi:hypothetical protein